MERLLVLSQNASRSSQTALDSDAAARQQTQTDHIASSTPRLVKNGPTRGHRRGRPKGVPLRIVVTFVTDLMEMIV